MTNQRVAINQSQKPLERYRGSLVYKLITILIDLRTPDERSSVTSRVSDFDIPEEAEHLPAGSSLAAVNLYHFPVTESVEIELTIRNQAGEHTALCRYCYRDRGTFLFSLVGCSQGA